MNDTKYTRPDTVQWERVAETSADLGEVPIWCSEESRLYWIDVYEGLLHRTDPESGKTETWSTGETVGSYALTDIENVVVVALQSGIYRLNLRGGALEKIFDAPYDPARWRFNDGRADRRGRFWVGNMPLRSLAGPQPQGQSSFWRIEGAEMRLGVEGMTVANGIAFGPQDDVLYLADRPTWSIQAFDYDIETGAASNRRTFVHLPEGMGPDGASVDTEGGYWLALVRAGLIARFLPDGSVDRVVRAPSSLPSMVSFGGPDLRTMYVTTIFRNLDEAGRRAEPLAGAVFRGKVGATGLPEPRFRLGR
jgi:L-arabinonolactonase